MKLPQNLSSFLKRFFFNLFGRNVLAQVTYVHTLQDINQAFPVEQTANIILRGENASQTDNLLI